MDKLEKLKNILKRMGSCLLAYSGGLDSTFLLKVASDCLGNKLLAVTADSPTYPKAELVFSRKMARALKARHLVIKTCELSDRRFSANPVNRCYYCKRELFTKLKNLGLEYKLNFVIDASNASDKKDFRPGKRARAELGVRSPLEEAGFTKDDIRRYSRRFGLASFNKPAQACLASRIPYGTKISSLLLKRIDQAEVFLKRCGFKQVRLRHYSGLCRIEVEPKEINRLINKRSLIVKRLKQLGYVYVTLDLEGYRTGSLNEMIKK